MRSYIITQFDETAGDIASRFHVDVNMLMYVNSDVFTTGAADDPIPQAKQGQTIQIPYDESLSRMWDWETHTAKNRESLSDVCGHLNKDPRIDPKNAGAPSIHPLGSLQNTCWN